MEESVKQRMEAAEQGDVEAQYALAVMYYHGNDVERDQKEAAWWLQRAASGGHEEAQYQLVLAQSLHPADFARGREKYRRIITDREGGPQERDEAFRWLYRVIEDADWNALQARVGKAMGDFHGDMGGLERQEAFCRLVKGVKEAGKEHRQACLTLEKTYFEGVEGGQKNGESGRWLQQVVNAKGMQNQPALELIGRLLSEGKFSWKQKQQAVCALLKAARDTFVPARELVCRVFTDRELFQEHKDEVLPILLLFAQEGFFPAQFGFATIHLEQERESLAAAVGRYYLGEWLAKTLVQGDETLLQLVTAAAGQGNAMAQSVLG